MKKRDSEIKIKFDDIAKNYDVQRKYLIPCFDDFYNITAELMDFNKGAKKNILDIGAGTGLLTKYIYDKYKSCRFTLIDLSGEMLKIAEKRFENLKNFKYINEDYVTYQFDEKYDAIVSSLSIHHLDNKNKFRLYKKIYDALDSGGIFINADQVLGSTKYAEQKNRKYWITRIENSPLTKKEKESAYSRMKLDKMDTLEENIRLLKKSGFKEIELFYKIYNFGIIYCCKE